ncbi:MAG TPA: hypothetical protein VFS59_18225, partial [Gemmatimonadaceae bacterium]|nr:hypothetical protein [Gemmatimonadaceae bacterium]
RESTAEVPARPPSRRLRAALALGACILSGLRAFLWISGEAKPRDFDQVWFAARMLLAGGNPYTQIGPGLPFDWPAPLYYPLTAVVTVAPLTVLERSLAAVLFAGLASGAFVWAATRRSLAPAVVITSASAALAAETVQWSPLLGAAYGITWLGVLLSAKPTIGFAIWIARPTRIAFVGTLVLLALSLALLPEWPRSWISALRHTSLGRTGGTPYFAPVGTLAGVSTLALLLRWRRPEARLVLALACMPQTPLLYETIPLFLVPASLKEGGVLWLGSWLAALWLSLGGPYETDLARFTVSARAVSWCLYLPCVIMILRRPNSGAVPIWLERALARVSARSRRELRAE